MNDLVGLGKALRDASGLRAEESVCAESSIQTALSLG